MLLGIILFLIGACEGLDLCAVYLFVLRLVKGRRFVKAETYHMMFARRGAIKGGQDILLGNATFPYFEYFLRAWALHV